MNFNRPLILASSSPRRQFLLRELGFTFEVIPSHADESFSDSLLVESIPLYLAQKKADTLDTPLSREVIIASDTVVILDNNVMNKPADWEEALQMLSALNGRTHMVITAVHLKGKEKSFTFEDRTQVTFRKSNRDELVRYIDLCQPFDKAGSYGAQECLPDGMNPCSPDEILFLDSVGKSNLAEKSKRLAEEKAPALIEKLDGSFFNVMGFPIHLVYRHLFEVFP